MPYILIENLWNSSKKFNKFACDKFCDNAAVMSSVVFLKSNPIDLNKHDIENSLESE